MASDTPHSHIPYTVREYELLPDDGRRHELIGGDFVVTPSPGTRHQTISLALTVLVGSWVREHRGRGAVFAAPTGVYLSDTDVVQPDLVVLIEGGNARMSPRGIEGPPHLVIEILSPSTERQDRILKRATYARFGIPHYWRVDPDMEEVTVDRLREAAYETVAVVGKAGTLTIEGLEGLELGVGELFE